MVDIICHYLIYDLLMSKVDNWQHFTDASDDGLNKNPTKQSNVNEFDEEWFVQHCRQVCLYLVSIMTWHEHCDIILCESFLPLDIGKLHVDWWLKDPRYFCVCTS